MRIRSRHILTLVLALTLVGAVLPTRWLGWTADTADIIRIPIMPLANVGNRIAGALRPVEVLRGGGSTVTDILQVESQRDKLERLLLAEQMRTSELETQLRQLQALPESTRISTPPLLVRTEVTGRRPDHPVSGVELQVPALDRIHMGDAVTWDGRWLVGRVTRVSGTRISALPITHPDIGPLMAVLLRDGEAVDMASAPRVLLRQDGRGQLLAEVDRRWGAQAGDRLVLADRAWPASLQAFHIGRVVSVGDIDEAPLRHRLVVDPEVQLYELPWVIIVGRDPGEPAGVTP